MFYRLLKRKCSFQTALLPLALADRQTDRQRQGSERKKPMSKTFFFNGLTLWYNKNAFQSKAHLPLTDRILDTYNLTLG